MYLNDITDGGYGEKLFEETFSNFFDISGYKYSVERDGILDTQVIIQTVSERYVCIITTFPGNCSGMILHNIQNALSGHRNLAASFTEKLCELFGYASLFISLTDEIVIAEFKEKGYEIIHTNNNAHSGADNYFMVKNIDLSEYEDD